MIGALPFCCLFQYLTDKLQIISSLYDMVKQSFLSGARDWLICGQVLKH